MSKTIFYLGGGAMAGVFSGGVITRLQEINFYDKIEAIYAGSSGAMNAAYFLSKQTKLGSTIYLDDLTHNFILPKNIPLGIAKLIWNKYIKKLPKDDTRYAVNIDYVFDCINKKPFSTDEIVKQPIDFFAKLLNIQTGKIEYLDAKKFGILKVLKATSCIQPYYPFFEEINGNKYVDGTIPEPIGLQYLLDLYPNHKIVVIVNSFMKRKFSNYLRCFAEGVVSHFCDYSLLKMYLRRETSLRNDLQLATETPRVLFICPPENMSVIAMTRNRKNLVEAFDTGKKMADKIIKFVD